MLRPDLVVLSTIDDAREKSATVPAKLREGCEAFRGRERVQEPEGEGDLWGR